MTGQKKNPEPKRFDTKELELPESVFVRDIENRVFQNIVTHCVAKIKDVVLVEGSFIDNIFGRGSVEGISGVQAEQDNQNHSLRIRIEVNVAYGISIPDKAEEIQTKVAEDITRLTGLHVASVHVVFKDLIMPKMTLRSSAAPKSLPTAEYLEEEYTDEFK